VENSSKPSTSESPLSPPPCCAAPPSPELVVWAAMRARADELGYGPSPMTNMDARGAQALYEAVGFEAARWAAEKLAEVWEAARARFRALASYPVPNLGAVVAISPLLGIVTGSSSWALPVSSPSGVKPGEWSDEADIVSAEGW